MSYLIIFSAIYAAILVHELGHYLLARWQNIPISQFSVGFGRKLVEFRTGKTRFRLGCIPLGGYVLPRLRRASDWETIPLRCRIWFMLGGPLANFLFAGGLIGMKELLYPSSEVFMLSEMVGIIGIVANGDQYIASNPANMLAFFAWLNLNLGFLNLLPIPPLDGSKVLLDVLSTITPRIRKFQSVIFKSGMLFIVGVSFTMAAQDISHLAA